MGRKNKSARISFRTTEAIHQELQDIADKEELDLSELLRAIIERAVKHRRKKNYTEAS